MRLVDFFLIIFMIILMGQSIYNLFSHEIYTQDRDAIDIVIRTTIASIFGYFISTNFLSVQKASQDKAPKEGTSLEDIELGSSPCEPKVSTKKVGCRVRQQIIIVSCFGLFSLIILIIVRNTNSIPESAIASVSQLRDFLSTSVGLLIGHSTKEAGK